jgi:hypothetical protein
VRLSHTLARTSAVFDDPNLVSHGGLANPRPQRGHREAAIEKTTSPSGTAAHFHAGTAPRSGIGG